MGTFGVDIDTDNTYETAWVYGFVPYTYDGYSNAYYVGLQS